MAAGNLLIAQISDTHIGAADANVGRLDRVLDHLCGMTRRPDLLLVTGDLADENSEAPYRMLRERLDRCPFPAYVCLGNHDSRGAARQIFPGGDDRFLHYVFDADTLRIIVLDTLEEGRHGGAFCEARAAWLRDRLAEAADQATLVVLHHPPIDSGIDWLTTSPEEPWVARLESVLADQPQIVALLAGHFHRPIFGGRKGAPVFVCPPIARQIALDLAPLDPEMPDGRALVVDGPPGFALHLWRGGTLTSHMDFVEDRQILADFDADMQKLVRKIFAERP
jgi:3',5'-cyclic AMP phosphodiesterase CpdA